jgi:hypothetical protein
MGQPYGYAQDSPVFLADPSGLCSQWNNGQSAFFKFGW